MKITSKNSGKIFCLLKKKQLNAVSAIQLPMQKKVAALFVMIAEETINKFVLLKNISISLLLSNLVDTLVSTMSYEELFPLWTEYLLGTSISLLF